MTFTSIDYDKFRALRVTHVATRLEELIADEANDILTPEQLFLTAVDDALEQRRAHKVEKLIRQARSSRSRMRRLRRSTTGRGAASPRSGCDATPPTTGGQTR